MAYAVTCSSCGARFSVGDDLFRRKFAGRVVTVRCKQCQAAIVLNASTPPPADSALATSPSPRARAVPRPPLKKQNRDSPGPFVALSPGLLGSQSVVDLSDVARSEPPSGLPPRGDRTGSDSKARNTGSDDIDFLLGLSAAPETTSALLGPPLPSFDAERAEAADAAEADTAAAEAARARREAEPETPPAAEPARRQIAPRRSRARALWLAATALVAVAAGIAFSSAERRTEPASAKATATPPVTTEARAPEPEIAAAPALERAVPEPAAARAVIAPPRRTPAPAPSASAAREPAAESTPATEPAAPEPSAAAPAGPFSRAAATTALNAAASEASACRKPGDPSGTASVTVTFAPSGRVTSATLSGPPYAGTATGGCIAATLRRARVPSFAGDNVTVAKTVVIR